MLQISFLQRQEEQTNQSVGESQMIREKVDDLQGHRRTLTEYVGTVTSQRIDWKLGFDDEMCLYLNGSCIILD